MLTAAAPIPHQHRQPSRIAIRGERRSDVAAREELLDLVMGSGRFTKSSERLREGRKPAHGLAFTAVEGTRLIGTVQSVGSAQQRKMFVTFHRAICPDGFSLEFAKFIGLDQIGTTGMATKVNHGYLEAFAAAAAIGGGGNRPCSMPCKNSMAR